MKTFFHNSNQHVDGYGDPNLGLHCVLGGAIEGFDSQVLLDPFEEQLDLPSTFVELCDGQGGQHEVVGKKDQAFACFGVVEFDPSDFVGIILSGVEAGEDAGLIAEHAASTVDLVGVQSSEPGIALSPDDKEGLREMYVVESGVIKVATVHDIEGSGLRNEVIEDVDVVDLAIGNECPGRDATLQIEQGMQFDSCLCSSERGPWEQFQTEINRGRVKCIDRLLEFQPKVIFRVELSCLRDQHLGEIGIDAPVPSFVCFCNSASGYCAFDAHVIPFFGNSSQAGFNISQTFPVRQLSEGHAEILVPAGERSHPLIAFVSLDAPAEFMHGEEIHKLRENQPAGIHMQPPKSLSGEYG